MDMDVSRLGATYGSQFTEPHQATRKERNREAAEAPAPTPPGKERTSEAEESRPMWSLVNRVMERRDHKVKLSVHEATNRVMIRVTDSETGEVINEIPRESYLDMVASFLSNLDRVHGVNLDEIC